VIFVSVGTQLPFDRLIRTVDRWATAAGRTDVVAQVGKGTYKPRTIEARPFLTPTEFLHFQQQSRLVVAHCGIGSMVSALEHGLPIIMMPRRHSLGEHRNDHQLATARNLRSIAGVYIAEDEHELMDLLQGCDRLTGPPAIASTAPPQFTAALASVLRELAS
jgi:UDP-N-acetylglucosamine transferase subunit ALG13